MIKICIILSLIFGALYLVLGILENRAVKKGKMVKQEDPLERLVKKYGTNGNATTSGTESNTDRTESDPLRYDNEN